MKTPCLWRHVCFLETLFPLLWGVMHCCFWAFSISLTHCNLCLTWWLKGKKIFESPWDLVLYLSTLEKSVGFPLKKIPRKFMPVQRKWYECIPHTSPGVLNGRGGEPPIAGVEQQMALKNWAVSEKGLFCKNAKPPSHLPHLKALHRRGF